MGAMSRCAGTGHATVCMLACQQASKEVTGRASCRLCGARALHAAWKGAGSAEGLAALAPAAALSCPLQHTRAPAVSASHHPPRLVCHTHTTVLGSRRGSFNLLRAFYCCSATHAPPAHHLPPTPVAPTDWTAPTPFPPLAPPPCRTPIALHSTATMCSPWRWPVPWASCTSAAAPTCAPPRCSSTASHDR